MSKKEIERTIAICLYSFEVDHEGDLEMIKDITEITKKFCDSVGLDWYYITNLVNTARTNARTLAARKQMKRSLGND